MMLRVSEMCVGGAAMCKGVEMCWGCRGVIGVHGVIWEVQECAGGSKAFRGM